MIDKFNGKEISLIVFPDVYSMSMSRLFVRLIVLAMKGDLIISGNYNNLHLQH